MKSSELAGAMETLLTELVDGASDRFAYMLNRGDPGLLRSLDRLSASAASASNDGGATIAGHVDHVRYGLSLMNRWAGGEENPFATADWTAAWNTTAVDDAEWQRLRGELRDQAHQWLQALRTPREMARIELNGVVGSIAHLAYHLGAIRQIDRTTRGPKAND